MTIVSRPSSVQSLLGGSIQLREDVVLPALGMPSDLDGNTIIDALDHSANYRVLPVRVRVRWQGMNGTRTMTADTVLCAR